MEKDCNPKSCQDSFLKIINRERAEPLALFALNFWLLNLNTFKSVFSTDQNDPSKSELTFLPNNIFSLFFKDETSISKFKEVFFSPIELERLIKDLELQRDIKRK
jgi:hypothetical protein